MRKSETSSHRRVKADNSVNQTMGAGEEVFVAGDVAVYMGGALEGQQLF